MQAPRAAVARRPAERRRLPPPRRTLGARSTLSTGAESGAARDAADLLWLFGDLLVDRPMERDGIAPAEMARRHGTIGWRFA
jgi:hypothetical protein